MANKIRPIKLTGDQLKREELRLVIATGVLAFSSVSILFFKDSPEPILGLLFFTLASSMLFSLLYILSTGAFLKYRSNLGHIGDIFIAPKIRFIFYDMMIDVFGINILLTFVWGTGYVINKIYPNNQDSDMWSWVIGLTFLLVFIYLNIRSEHKAKSEIEKY